MVLGLLGGRREEGQFWNGGEADVEEKVVEAEAEAVEGSGQGRHGLVEIEDDARVEEVDGPTRPPRVTVAIGVVVGVLLLMIVLVLVPMVAAYAWWLRKSGFLAATRRMVPREKALMRPHRAERAHDTFSGLFRGRPWILEKNT